MQATPAQATVRDRLPRCALPGRPAPAASAYQGYQILRRNGAVVSFEPNKIAVALMKAFLAVHGTQGAASASVRETVDGLTESVVRGAAALASGRRHLPHRGRAGPGRARPDARRPPRGRARLRALPRAARAGARQAGRRPPPSAEPVLMVTDRGERVPLDVARAAGADRDRRAPASAPTSGPSRSWPRRERNLYDGVPIDEVHKAAILAARTLIEKDPGYTRATARLLLHTIRREILGEEVLAGGHGRRATPSTSRSSSRRASAPSCSTRSCSSTTSARLGAALKADRDLQFDYLGLQTLYDRYFLHIDEARIELPQAFFMRVAMGLALNEIDREARAIEFYDVLSSFDFMSSTPTLFNAGTRRSQLSSCYLTTVADDLDGIYEALKENALLSKFAGGLGNDWTNVRALGSHIKGTNGKSQGVVPFLKVVNDTAVAVNQGGKRKGAVCAYLETWHLDIEEFLELRKNTGDDRRRTHDMNTANWIPDLFMKRVMEGGDWTLFSPSAPARPARQVRPGLRGGLHRLRGQGGARRDQALQEDAGRRPVAQDAVDAVRDRASVDHVQGRLQRALAAAARRRRALVATCAPRSRSTPATTEIAVCNLGSVNLAQHIGDGELDQAKLKKTVAHRDADARQRHRHQLLRGQEGARLEPAAPPGRPRHHGLPGLRCTSCGVPYASRGGGRVRRPLDGSGLLPRLLGLDRTGRRSAAATRATAARCGTAASCRIDTLDAAGRASAAATSRSTARATLDWDALRARISAARHAQLELRRDRADRDDLQHHRRQRLDRAVVRQPVRQVEPVGRVHRSSTSTWCAT